MENNSRAQTVLAVVGVLLGTVLQAIDGSIVNVAIPRIQADLSAPIALTGWAVTAYALASLIAMPLAASLAQRHGVRAFFATSVALFTAASLACGLSRSVGTLIAFRAVQGLGAGGLLPLSQTVLMSLFPGARRGTALALVGCAAVLGPLFGPPVGGLLTDHFGWPAIFTVNVPLGILSIGLVLRYLRDLPVPEAQVASPGRRLPKGAREPLDLAGAGLLALVLVSLQVGCAHHPLLFLPAALFGALFVRRERSVAAPAVDLSVLRHRGLGRGLSAAALYGAGLYASVFLLPLLLERQMGMSASAAGLVIAVGGIGSGSLILCAGPLLARFRARTVCIAGAATFTVSMLLLARASLLGSGPVVLAQALRGAGTGLLYVGMNGFAFEGVPDEDIATGSSLFYLLRQLGGSLGVALSAAALEANEVRGLTAAFFALSLTAPVSLVPLHIFAGRSTPPAVQARKAAAGAGPAPEAM